MEIIRMDEVEEAQTPRKIEVRKVLKKKDVQVVYLKFKPGEELPLHTTKVDVFFYIVEGEGKITVGNETGDGRGKGDRLQPCRCSSRPGERRGKPLQGAGGEDPQSRGLTPD